MFIVKWRDASGKTYDFSVHDIGSPLIAVPACYIFTKVNPASGGWVPIYIGQTSDLSRRVESHHKLSCISRNGATHICAYTRQMSSLIARLSLERDLLSVYRTPCND